LPEERQVFGAVAVSGLPEPDGALYLKNSLDVNPELQDVPTKLFVPRDQHILSRVMHASLFNEQNNGSSTITHHQAGDQRQKARLVDFYGSIRTASYCLDSGAIQLSQFVQNSFKQNEPTSIVCTGLFKIETNSGLSLDSELMSPASSCSRPPSRMTVAHCGSEDGSVVSERSFALTNFSTGHTPAAASNRPAPSRHVQNVRTYQSFQKARFQPVLYVGHCNEIQTLLL
jgi:hypothetical protein